MDVGQVGYVELMARASAPTVSLVHDVVSFISFLFFSFSFFKTKYKKNSSNLSRTPTDYGFGS